MTAVLLTAHVLIVLSLIGVVLLQRSDGGALGLGGGGGGGGFMTGRGAANALTRTTAILAALFFATSMGLAIMAERGEKDETVFKQLTGDATEQTAPAAPGDASTEDLLKSLGAEDTEKTPADTAAAPSPDNAETPANDGKAAAAPAPASSAAADQPNSEGGETGGSDKAPSQDQPNN